MPLLAVRRVEMPARYQGSCSVCLWDIGFVVGFVVGSVWTTGWLVCSVCLGRPVWLGLRRRDAGRPRRRVERRNFVDGGGGGKDCRLQYPSDDVGRKIEDVIVVICVCCAVFWLLVGVAWFSMCVWAGCRLPLAFLSRKIEKTRYCR